MALWQWSELAVLGQPAGVSGPDIQGVCIDSRQIAKGDLFIALSGDPGPRFNSSIDNPRDGHDFIAGALLGGAAAVMLTDIPDKADFPYVQVNNTLDGLWSLGRAARARCAGQVVAITGSAGKTTARSWLMQCLQEQFATHGSLGSLNNHWGVPLSLGRMPRETQVGVFEIGTNHPGEISPLSCLVSPDVSILLNVLPAHIGNFESLQALELEKRSIADGLSAEGKFILPLELASNDPRQITFGLNEAADVSARYEVTDAGWRVSADVQGSSVNYTLVSGGEHKVLTSLAVLAAAHTLGADLTRIAARFLSLDTPEGRGNERVIGEVTVIDDSYNANPVSMQYAMDALLQRSGRKIALLGEIMELGDEAAAYHQQIATAFAHYDQVITVGDGFAATPGQQHFGSSKEIDLSALVSSLQPGDTLLVKGSNKVFWVNGFVNALVDALATAGSR